MQRKLTITLDEAVYEGIHRMMGKRGISKFIEDLVRPHIANSSLDEGYKAMAADSLREAEATEWCNALAGKILDESR